MKSLNPIQTLDSAVWPHFLQVHNNVRPHLAGVSRQHLEDKGMDTIQWPLQSLDLNPIEQIIVFYFGPLGTDRMFLRIHSSSRMSLSSYERIFHKTQCIVAMGAYYNIVRHAYVHTVPTKDTEKCLELQTRSKFITVGQLDNFSSYIWILSIVLITFVNTEGLFCQTNSRSRTQSIVGYTKIQ